MDGFLGSLLLLVGCLVAKASIIQRFVSMDVVRTVVVVSGGVVTVGWKLRVVFFKGQFRYIPRELKTTCNCKDLFLWHHQCCCDTFLFFVKDECHVMFRQSGSPGYPLGILPPASTIFHALSISFLRLEIVAFAIGKYGKKRRGPPQKLSGIPFCKEEKLPQRTQKKEPAIIFVCVWMVAIFMMLFLFISSFFTKHSSPKSISTTPPWIHSSLPMAILPTVMVNLLRLISSRW